MQITLMKGKIHRVVWRKKNVRLNSPENDR
jgi:hypothetical protein